MRTPTATATDVEPGLTMADALLVGLMSGTSVDGIDCALVSIGSDGGVSLLHSLEKPIPAPVQQEIRAISQPGLDEIERLGQLDRKLGLLFAEAVRELLADARIPAGRVRAIGSHGQTIRHRPAAGSAPGEQGFTLQIGDPNTIAEETGITTVADFRRRDVAAGGEGAPLAPAFHAAAFSHRGVNRAILNIGGIANVSLLQGERLLAGFDTGPGNTLLDQWVAKHRGDCFDRDGAWAAAGRVDTGLLEQLCNHAYFSRQGPRSTGKETFNMAWLEEQLAATGSGDPRDIQATLSEFTARTIVHGIDTGGLPIAEVYVCGGGAHNGDLMRRLYRHLRGVNLQDTSALGLDPDWVEAAAFAWLAQQALQGLAGNAPAVTGASGPRILGGVFAGRSPS
jgi:anhydro-N-acetylmuramic acid kinase